VDCPVEPPSGDPYGEFANALRISLDGGQILLDFCVYSESENTARVVSRVRVSKDFIPIIHQKIGASFSLTPDSELSTLFVMPAVLGSN